MVAPYKATAMKAGSIHGKSDKGGEYQADRWDGSVVKSTIPSKADAKSSMHDGPYGGKKPQS